MTLEVRLPDGQLSLIIYFAVIGSACSFPHTIKNVKETTTGIENEGIKDYMYKHSSALSVTFSCNKMQPQNHILRYQKKTLSTKNHAKEILHLCTYLLRYTISVNIQYL